MLGALCILERTLINDERDVNSRPLPLAFLDGWCANFRLVEVAGQASGDLFLAYT
jgi:hypothetical protein